MGWSKDWVKNNLFIITATVLPLLVAALFGLATLVPRWLVEAPTVDALFVMDPTTYDNQPFDVRYRITEGKLYADVAYVDGSAMFINRRLYRYQAATGDLVDVTPVVPDVVKSELYAESDGNKQVSAAFEVGGTLASITISSNPVASDGYEFRNAYQRGPGLFGEMFGMRGRHHLVALSKDGRIVELPVPASDPYRYYRNTRLIGWIEQ